MLFAIFNPDDFGMRCEGCARVGVSVCGKCRLRMWREQNREHVRESDAKYRRAYRERLASAYVRAKLGLKAVHHHDGLVSAKRALIKLHRIIKE